MKNNFEGILQVGTAKEQQIYNILFCCSWYVDYFNLTIG
jgi:hypothetical protein